MGSYFKGWTNTLPNMPMSLTPSDSQEVFIGQVLDVDYDNTPGKIKVRLVGVSTELKDEDITTEALPADLSILKLPLPGELVFIVQAVSNDLKSNKPALSYYYITTFSSNRSITYNSDPYIGNLIPVTMADKVFTEEYDKRFEKKIQSLQSYKNDITEEVISKRQLKPFEGDVILQGRSGASVRLGGTGTADNNPWSKRNADGEPGNPIVIMAANGINEATSTSPAVENINEDNSSVYLSTKQIVEIKMATSTQLATHKHRYDIKDTLMTNRDLQSTFIATEFHAGVAGLGGGGEFGGGSMDLGDLGENLPPEQIGLIDPNAKVAYALIIAREGYTSEAQWDICNWRIGHGSAYITLGGTVTGKVIELDNNYKLWPSGWIDKANGILKYTDIGDYATKSFLQHNNNNCSGKVQPAAGKIWNPWVNYSAKGGNAALTVRFTGGNALITRAEANADLGRYITQNLLPAIKKQIGDQAYASIGAGGVAALSSIKYNYGNITSQTGNGMKLIDAAKSGNKQTLAATVAVLSGGSAERHQAEAAAILQY